MDDFESLVEKLRRTEFSRLGDRIFLDYTGSALYAKYQLQKYFDELENNLFGNPHSGNACSDRMNDIVHQVRCATLEFFNASLNEYDVIFTSGATSALRTIGDYFDWKPGSVYAYLEDNHTSVVGIRELAASQNAANYCLRFEENDSGTKTHDLKSYRPILVKGSDVEKNVDASETIPCLFAYPAQSNFSGAKYPLEWVNELRKRASAKEDFVVPHENTRKTKWYVLLDAAAFVQSSFLNLKQFSPDFVTLSFYKLFGFPTGLGALLVRKQSENVLSKKTYFGGGAVSGWLSADDFHIPKPVLHERMEDGSISFLSILALKHGFDYFKEFKFDMSVIQKYTFELWSNLYHKMTELKHWNGAPAVEIYLPQKENLASSKQGPVVAFNVLRADGSYVGYNQVLQLANSNNIYLRGGCFCNMGACSSLLHASGKVLRKAYTNGHVCGDNIDVIDGKPIGALRASLGYSTTRGDVYKFLQFLSNCFREESGGLSMVNGDMCHFEKPHNIVLDKIVVYPVKSCQGMEVEKWEISNTGLLYDRMWVIVDEHNICVTLKKNPQLVLIHPNIIPSKRILILRAKGMEDIRIPFMYSEKTLKVDTNLAANPHCNTKVCGDRIEGFNCGAHVSLWLSKVLGKKYFLVQKSLAMHRFAKERRCLDGTVCELSLVNEAQYLLINRSSVEYLCKCYTENHDERAVNNLIGRFRGNFVISGASPFSEDDWEDVVVNVANEAEDCHGPLQFSKCGLCNRCSMVCVDPDTGQKMDEPLKSLLKLTLPPDYSRRKATFGIYLQCKSAASVISRGSKVLLQN